VWVPGVTFRDRLALWGMAKLNPHTNLDDHAVLAQVCAHLRYPLERCLQLQRDVPEAWAWLEWQQYLRRRGLPSDANAGRVRAAMITSLKTRHKGILKRMERHNGRPIEEIL
jgi:hypothetical protein